MADEDDDSHIIASVRRILGEDASRPRPGHGGAVAAPPDIYELEPRMMIDPDRGARAALSHPSPPHVPETATMPDEEELSPDLAAWASEYGDEDETPGAEAAPPPNLAATVSPPPEPVEETTSGRAAPAPAAPEAPAPLAEPVVEKQTEDAASHAFGSLRDTIRAQREAAATSGAATGLATSSHAGGPTIEEMIRQELRPLLKLWLDAHLPELVDRIVRAEIARIAERAGD